MAEARVIATAATLRSKPARLSLFDFAPSPSSGGAWLIELLTYPQWVPPFRALSTVSTVSSALPTPLDVLQHAVGTKLFARFN